MDLPKILLTGLFFLFFFGFPRVFGQLGLGQQKPREKPNKPKKTKKTILNGFTQDSSHRIGFFVFLFFFGFPRVFGQLGLGQQKPREKPNNPKKPKKTILNGLTQDSSHRIVFFVFFWFSSSFWTVGLGTAKTVRKTK